MTAFAAILVFLAGFLTIGVGVNLSALHASDAAGNGLAQGFATVLAIALWAILAVLLLICGARDGFPRFSGIVMLFAVPLGLAGQVAAMRVLMADNVQGVEATLLTMVGVGVPMLVIARAAWGIFPFLRSVIPEAAGSWPPIVLLVLLSLLPFPFRSQRIVRDEAAEARSEALIDEYRQRRKVQDDERIAEAQARIEALTTNSELFSAIVFCADPEPAIREAARAKARTFIKRQTDAEALLAEGHEATLRELPNFDLRTTPAICARAKNILASKESIKPFDNDPVRIEDAEREVGLYTGTMRWLLANGCDCGAEVTGLTQAVGRFADSPRRARLLAELASVKSGR